MDIKPQILDIQGSTDGEGDFTFTQYHKGVFNVDLDDEVTILNFSYEAKHLGNMTGESSELDLVFLNSNVVQKRLIFPKQRIATVADLIEALEILLLSYPGATGWQIESFGYGEKALKPNSLTSYVLKIHMNIVKNLGFTLDGKTISSFANLFLKPSSVAMQISGDYCLCSVAKDPSKIPGAAIIADKKDLVWPTLTPKTTPAYILVNADFIKDNFVGRERVKNLDIFGVDPLETKNRTLHLPENLRYSRFDVIKPASLKFTLQTSVGTKLTDFPFRLQLAVRRKDVF